jgi:rod shape-determining protein MreD
MVDPLTSRLWGYRLLFVWLVSVIVFVRLLPMGDFSGGLPGPELMLALTFAWLLRQPDYVPAPLIVAVFLTADFLFHNAPGLWALLVLGGTEFLRARQATAREIPFALEWALVAGVLAAMVAMNHLILSVMFVETPPAGMFLLQALFTVLVYPAVVGASYLLFDLRRTTSEEVALRGGRT